MKNERILLLLSLVLGGLLPSPSPVNAQSPLAAENSEAVDQREGLPRIARAEELMASDDLAAAQREIAPLLARQTPPEAALELAAEINRRRVAAAIERGREQFESSALEEVEQRMTMPESYGETKVISARGDIPEHPVPHTQGLLNRSVSMQLQNASLRDLVFKLSEIDGLNVIADEALSPDKRISVSVNDVPLRDVLEYVARNMQLDFHIGPNIVWVTEATDSQAAITTALETRVYSLQHGFIPDLAPDRPGYEPSGTGDRAAATETGDNELEDALARFFQGPPGTSYRIYRNRNLLIVRNTPENLAMIEQIIRQLDRRPMQVLIEARFVTIAREDLLSLGLNMQNLIVPADGTVARFQDFVADQRKITVTRDKSGNVKNIVEEKTETIPESLGEKRFQALGTGEVTGLPGQITVSGILGNVTYQIVLDALRQKSSSQTLSAPRITVLNNRSAFIHRGKTRYYFKEYDLQSVDEGDAGIRSEVTPVGEPQELDLGYKLNVNVNIGNNGRTIFLALKPEINEFLGFETAFGDQIKLPNVARNTLSTTVSVESGETVVLGGTLSNDVSTTEKRVPVIGDIPYVGRIFRHKEDVHQPEHLLIFVTARIVSGDGKFVEIESGDGRL